MRLYCEFSNCCCQNYIGKTSRCFNCGHGDCWHANDHGQFDSPRLPAARAKYMYILMPILPTVPPLPEDSPRFCQGVIALPV